MARRWIPALWGLLLIACDHSPASLFTIRQGPELGIGFQNTITTSDTLNALSFEYIYNGSGVGIGDFNQDGLPDLYFGGNQVTSRLYLNTGGLTFEDVTLASGTSTDRWITGVSVADINGDGWDDIYLCVAGKVDSESRRNLLFINRGVNNGVPRFAEAAHDYDLDDDSYSTMAAFFDYDKDGDQDLYLVNNWLEKFNRNNLRPRRVKGEAESTDRLYRNNGDNTFTNVSFDAGISIEGYGLGVNICDINRDSWPDVYVSNDFLSNDLLWINQKDGTFVNKIGTYLRHQTHNGMGVDVADFNNDELPDIVVVDMLPPGHKRQKLMTPGQNYDFFHMSLDAGYEPQYMRNTLQLNRGPAGGAYGFSEIAFLSGVARTDWSWAPLFADFDNDGDKDLFIGNGYRKDVTDLDFVFFGLGGSPFGTVEKRKEKFNEELDRLPEVKLPNYVYENTGTMSFTDRTRDWGLELPTFTNGAAYADLDNDGDIDIVTNNIDQEVIVYENSSSGRADHNHYIRMTSIEKSDNQKIWVFINGASQYIEMTPYRGFQSTVERAAHFGTGHQSRADSILILWPDSTSKKYYDVPADTTIQFSRDGATHFEAKPVPQPVLLEQAHLASYRHVEKSPSDILSTRTLLHELTRFGPCLASGDVNGDGLDDFLVGGEAGEPSTVFIQMANGSFVPLDRLPATTSEVGAALFADIDADGDCDLYVASAASRVTEKPAAHRIYFNDGAGHFTPGVGTIPEITTSSSCVVSADIDGDGDADLFVGGRVKIGQYPFSPRSYILLNEGGKFSDATRTWSPDLVEPGMVSSAAWDDINNDGKVDLIIAGEWLPIRVFINTGKELKEVTAQFGLKNSDGWWNCIKLADLNNDGYDDIIAGNTGSNSFFHSSVQNPVQLVASDFDHNGSVDPIITYYNEVEKDRFIVHNRLVLIDQIPSIKRRFETFTQYATTPFSRIFTPAELKGAFLGNAFKLESVVLINQGGNGFLSEDLPEVAQFSTVNDIIVTDINGDSHRDLLLIGNNYAQETLFGRYDASMGVVLLGDGNLNWTSLPISLSGFNVSGDSRYMKMLRSAHGATLVVGNNNEALQFFIRKAAVSTTLTQR